MISQVENVVGLRSERLRLVECKRKHLSYSNVSFFFSSTTAL